MGHRFTRDLSSRKSEGITRVFMSSGSLAMHRNSTLLSKSGMTSRDIVRTACFLTSKTFDLTCMQTQDVSAVRNQSYAHSSSHPNYHRPHGNYTLLMRNSINTPVYGIALGIPLNKAHTGPFAQFQNCEDKEESLTQLVLQLLKYFFVIACCHYETFNEYFLFMNSIASCFVILCFIGIFLFIIALFLILKPGLSRVTETSKPIIPIEASYCNP